MLGLQIGQQLAFGGLVKGDGLEAQVCLVWPQRPDQLSCTRDFIRAQRTQRVRGSLRGSWQAGNAAFLLDLACHGDGGILDGHDARMEDKEEGAETGRWYVQGLQYYRFTCKPIRAALFGWIYKSETRFVVVGRCMHLPGKVK